jgi:hypothetical protein
VPCEIYAYSDASWADIVPQRKSSLTYLIFCNNVVFSWKSPLSSVLAMSFAEAELIALFACAANVANCGKLANELCFLQLHPTIIHEDNVGAKQFAESENFRESENFCKLKNLICSTQSFICLFGLSGLILSISIRFFVSFREFS